MYLTVKSEQDRFYVFEKIAKIDNSFSLEHHNLLRLLFVNCLKGALIKDQVKEYQIQLEKIFKSKEMKGINTNSDLENMLNDIKNEVLRFFMVEYEDDTTKLRAFRRIRNFRIKNGYLYYQLPAFINLVLGKCFPKGIADYKK